MKLFEAYRKLFRDQLCQLDEKEVKEIQQELVLKARQNELLLNDVQLRLDYLGVFTPQNITKLARNLERKDAKKT